MNETCFERSKQLKSLIKDWCPKPRQCKFAKTEDWFGKVFEDPTGTWVWSPPPCLAEIAVEQLCKVKHVFPKSQHIFVCPALMTGYWMKALGKVADTKFTMKAGSEAWPHSMLEPLTIAFVCPLLTSPPWQARRLRSVAEWERPLLELQWTDKTSIRNHMREFWLK